MTQLYRLFIVAENGKEFESHLTRDGARSKEDIDKYLEGSTLKDKYGPARLEACK